MKKLLVGLVVAVAQLMPLYAQVTTQKAVTPTFVARSQSRYKFRQLVGDGWNGIERERASIQSAAIAERDVWEPQTVRDRFFSKQQSQQVAIKTKNSVELTREGWYGSLSMMPEYTRTFNGDDISQCLFGSDVCNGTILVQGSDVADRNDRAWLADYLYLSPDFNGQFSINPVIQNFLIDFDFYWGMDKVVQGLYFRMYGPLVWTKWSTNFCESTPQDPGTSGYEEGYFTPNALPQSALNQSIQSYMTGNAPADVDDITFYGLQFSKIINCNESKVGFADLRMELGWNFIEDDYHHLAINLQAACPTGNMRKACFVLEPVVGNGNHWELGAGFNTHYTFWRNELKERSAHLYLDLNMTHIFEAYEQRTFDLSDSPNSRYMLAERIQGPVEDGLTAQATSSPLALMSTPPSAQFKKIYSPVANLTTAQPKVSNAVQVDFVALINFTSRNVSLDVGYNLWARTCDNITNARRCSSSLSIFNEENERVWALKGDAHMFGYATAAAGGLVLDQAIALSATQSVATIHQGTNVLVPGNRALNLGVDTAEFAYAGTTNQELNYARGLPAAEANHIKTSNVPEFINYENINQQTTRGLSNTFFAHLSYTWKDVARVEPYLGGGFMVEVGSNKANIVTPKAVETSFIDVCDDECITCSLSQWGVWIKTGFIFG